MDPVIIQAKKDLRVTNIIHIVLYALIFTFNLVLIPKIYWLKKVFKFSYLIASLIHTINFVVPIISLIYIFRKKLNKKNIKFFKIIENQRIEIQELKSQLNSYKYGRL